MFRCRACPCQGLIKEVIKHVLRFHLPDNLAPYFCPACNLRMMSKQYAVQHVSKNHPGRCFEDALSGKGNRLTAYSLRDFMWPVTAGETCFNPQDPLGLMADLLSPPSHQGTPLPVPPQQECPARKTNPVIKVLSPAGSPLFPPMPEVTLPGPHSPGSWQVSMLRSRRTLVWQARTSSGKTSSESTTAF